MARDIADFRHEPATPDRGHGIREPRAVSDLDKPLDARERPARRERFGPFRVTDAERQTLNDIGRFRTVAAEDLLRHRYNGRTSDLREHLGSLAAQGLIQRRTAWIGRGQGKLDVVVLTRSGKAFLERQGPADAVQTIYAGFVKPSEVAHDAAIYRMFQAETSRLEEQGNTIRRVVLDYELKRRIYSPLAKLRQLPAAEFARRQQAVAREHGLKVIRGKIPLPDLRIEYETRDGEIARVDLELATSHYHGSHLRTKAEAGFVLYAPHQSVPALTRVMDERELTATILSL